MSAYGSPDDLSVDLLVAPCLHRRADCRADLIVPRSFCRVDHLGARQNALLELLHPALDDKLLFLARGVVFGVSPKGRRVSRAFADRPDPP